jgi:predicted nucleotidyltransferase
VVETNIFTNKEITFLRELDKQGVEFMIVGLAAAALQGAPVVTQDIDLWFRDPGDPRIGKALKKVGGVLVAPIGDNPPMFAGKSVELFDIVLTMHGLESFADEIKNTVTVQLGRAKIKALKLERIIKSKEYLHRKKDELVLPVLKDVLKTLTAVGARKRKK